MLQQQGAAVPARPVPLCRYASAGLSFRPSPPPWSVSAPPPENAPGVCHAVGPSRERSLPGGVEQATARDRRRASTSAEGRSRACGARTWSGSARQPARRSMATRHVVSQPTPVPVVALGVTAQRGAARTRRGYGRPRRPALSGRPPAHSRPSVVRPDKAGPLDSRGHTKLL